MSQQKIGQCIYCGQTQMVDVGDGIPTKEELDKKATAMCDCDDAKNAQESAKVQTEAEENVESLFRKEFPDTASLLKAAVLPIMAGQMDKMTIDTGKRVKGQITRTSKGNIKVERIETRKMVLES